jgi:predicted DsbA family dithiol-disulfide isomerase
MTATASIDFFADLVCPWCYVGWAALKKAARETPDVACSVQWRNFLLNPDTPPEGVDRRAYYERLRASDPDRMAASRDALLAAAAAADAPLNLDAAERMPNTINAHRLIHWAAGQGAAEAAIDALFEAFFVEGRDIGETDVLTDIGASAGLDEAVVRDLLATEADREAVLTFHSAAIQLGVRGVPVVIVNRRAVLMGAEPAETYAKALRESAAPAQ